MTKTELKRIAKAKWITHCYIRKGSYYRPNACGYTDYQAKAGIYTKEDALKHAEHCSELTLIPIENAKHNAMLLEEVNELLSRIICV